MKVNNNANKAGQTGLVRGGELNKEVKGNKSNGAGAAQDAGSLLGSTKVNMSKDAMALQKAKAIASKNDVDEAKVARLQKLIDDGKYRVDAQAVADRLVDEHLATGE